MGHGASAVGEEGDVSQTHNLACLLAGEPVQKFDGSLTSPAQSHQFPEQGQSEPLEG